MTLDTNPSATLAAFAADLSFDTIPAPVLRRTEDLFLDWYASALAGKGARPVEAIEAYARTMGPDSGRAEVLISRRTTSPHLRVSAATKSAKPSGLSFSGTPPRSEKRWRVSGRSSQAFT